jgi:4'-phosphopantetheinyl transferase
LVRVWWGRRTGDARQAARALLIGAASVALDRPAESIIVSYRPGGGPCLLGSAAGLHVGVSHSRDGLVAVVTSGAGPVGVDIEAVRPRPWPALAERYFDPSEYAWLSGLPADQQLAAFLRLWTYKEAVGKAYGVGLRGGGLRRVGGAEPPSGELPPEGPWPLRAGPADPAMLVAVAQPAPDVMLAVACAGTAGSAVAMTCSIEERPSGERRSGFGSIGSGRMG